MLPTCSMVLAYVSESAIYLHRWLICWVDTYFKTAVLNKLNLDD